MGLFSKKNPFKKWNSKLRKKFGLTSHNKLGRSLKHFQHLFTGGNSASNVYKSSYNGSNLSTTYQYNGKTLSQLTGGV